MIELDVQTWAAATGIIITVVGGFYVLVRLIVTKFEQVDARFEQVDARFETLRQEMRAENKATRDELNGSIRDVRDELNGSIRDVRDDLGARNSDVRDELSGSIRDVRDDLGARISDVRDELIDVRAGLRAIEQRFFELLLPRRPAATGTDDT